MALVETIAIAATGHSVAKEKQLRDLSVKLEAAFLAEVLKSAGFGKARETMGGGAGEAQFASFTVQQHAQSLAEQGGIGLAEHLFNSLKGRSE